MASRIIRTLDEAVPWPRPLTGISQGRGIPAMPPRKTDGSIPHLAGCHAVNGGLGWKGCLTGSGILERVSRSPPKVVAGEFRAGDE